MLPTLLAWLATASSLLPAFSSRLGPEGWSWNQSERIVGGVNATAGEFPFMLSLQMNPNFGDRYHYCAGSILNATHVVTAAHCVVDRQLDQVQIVAGAYNLSSEEETTSTQRRGISSVTVHPSFDSAKLHHDIAILALNQSFQFNSQVQPMPLPPPDFTYLGNCTIIGWGSSLGGGSESIGGAQLLQKFNMTLVPSQTCQSTYEFIFDHFDNSTMICATGSRDDMTQGPCSGDSGAPLLCKSSADNETEVVAGIMSWSMIPCGDSSYPSIYMNVTTLSAFS